MKRDTSAYSIEAYETHLRRLRMGYLFVAWSLFWMALYIIGSNYNESLANISTVMYSGGLTLTLILSYRHVRRFKLSWFFLILMLGVWTLGDAFWALVSWQGIDATELPWLENIYTLSNISMMIASVWYFLGNLKKWHGIQLALDIGIIGFLIAIVILRLYIPSAEIARVVTHEFWTVGILIFTDVITVLIMIGMLSTSRDTLITRTMLSILIGIILYSATDMWYVYRYLKDTYIANTFIDTLYLLSLFFISAAGVNEVIHKDTSIKFIPDHTGNFKTSKIVLGLLLLPLLLYFGGYLTQMDLWLSVVGVTVYYAISHYLQKAMMVEMLFKREHELALQLEALVEERTQQLRQANQILELKAKVDPLTGLDNREYFLKTLRGLFGDNGCAYKAFAIIHIDVDRFKVVNDIHGHDMGDKVLVIIAKRLNELCGSRLRDANYHIGRIGGDEFGIFLELSQNEQDQVKELQHISEAIIAAVQTPVTIGHYRFYFGATIGVARFPQDGGTIDALVKSADIAMNHAKKFTHASKFALYSSELVNAIARRNYIEWLLRNANFKTDFELFYQPQFSSEDKTLIGMEALIRWPHADEGYISPAEFIPIAESIGMIADMSMWIFETAMIQMRQWQETYRKPIRMGINVSALLFDNVDFLPQIQRFTTKLGVSPSWFDLEITETGAINATNHVEEIFTKLSQMGFTISIDDFGTGYSALSYLKRFSVHTIKIAKELIDTLESDSQDHMIVQAITMMAKGMALKTIAEGVETEAQFEALKALGCDGIQGYYLGKPCNAQAFEEEYLI